MANKINILLIGVGPNAEKLYLPAIQKYSASLPVKLAATVDIKGNESPVLARLIKNGYDASTVKSLFVTTGEMTRNNQGLLNKIVVTERINAVIIATEPLSHKMYALWALKHNLAILMDKPITTRRYSAIDPVQARGIYDDFKELDEAYKKSEAKLFTISAQRRYHPGFELVFEHIAEIRDRFGIPVTSQQTLHADGQWRLPEEIITQMYHPYNIYGKVSHSGYHFIDVIAQVIKLGYANQSETIDHVSVFSSFVYARGLLNQLSQKKLKQILGKRYERIASLSDEDLYKAFENYGEVDASSIISLKHDSETVGTITLNLLHNSFSRRSWHLPGDDLYKGNGRVKHEYHSIQQGPFQNIQIHSYQKNDKHYKNSDSEYEFGGSNHFDVHIFRNNSLTGDKTPLRTFNLKDITDTGDYTQSSNIHDQIKFKAVKEFIETLISPTSHPGRSSLETHELSALLMSLIYLSASKNREVSHQIKGLI